MMKTIANLEKYWVLLIFAYEYFYTHGGSATEHPEVQNHAQSTALEQLMNSLKN